MVTIPVSCGRGGKEENKLTLIFTNLFIQGTVGLKQESTSTQWTVKLKEKGQKETKRSTNSSEYNRGRTKCDPCVCFQSLSQRPGTRVQGITRAANQRCEGYFFITSAHVCLSECNKKKAMHRVDSSFREAVCSISWIKVYVYFKWRNELLSSGT